MNFQDIARRRVFLLFAPIAVGLVVLILLVSNQQQPNKNDEHEPVRAVRFVTANNLDLVPVAEGYGPVEPARVWRAVAQVSGRIIEIHPLLNNGEILPAGTPLFRIDPVDYELALAKARAELAELGVKEKNTKSSIAIEQRNLILAQREMERIKQLVGKGTTSQSNADASERTVLAAKASVQNLLNTLSLIPAQHSLIEAKVSQAERDLAHTRVSAPFNMRVAALAIEADQYVGKGERLFEGDAVDRVEVVAQVAMSSLRNLFIGLADMPADIPRMNEKVVEFAGFRPKIRLDMGNHVAEWEAEFVRISDRVDPKTRTIGIVVAVDRPMQKIKPGYRPPLSKGMFVQVLLRGRTQPGRIAVPRSAIRDGKVHLIDGDNRLRTEVVEVLFNQGMLSVIGSGVVAGDRIVVSDPTPAVAGMLLQPVADPMLQQQLRSAAGEHQ